VALHDLLSDPEYKIDFPTLFVAGFWVRQHCVVPDGFRRASRSTRRLAGVVVAELLPASAGCAGQAPYTSAHVCLEGVGPALFAGWARGGEVYDCRDHGCGCGWTYEYQPGEAMGRPWPTPLIQITAFSEKQTDNIYSALRPMIDEGPLAALITKTGEEFIRLPNRGRIDIVTSEARSRLGQRVTFVPQDETGVWTASAKMIEVAETQRRGLAGMGGRGEETTNAWDPNQGSVAQRTAEAAEKTGDIFRLHPLPTAGLSYKNKAERRKIHQQVYGDWGCTWIDEDAIEGEAAELIILDAAQAERFFGNRAVAGAGVAFDIDKVKARKLAVMVPKGAIITIGVDGALKDDALAVVATDVKSGFSWPLCIIERPKDAADDYEHDQSIADGAMIEAMEMYQVWRVYIDDQYIDSLVEKWRNRYGQKRIIVWRTNRPLHMAWAVRELEEAIAADPANSSSAWFYNGDATLTEHFANAQKALVNIKDDKEREMHILAKDSKDSPRKKDGADATVLSWKARSDAVELGVVSLDPEARDPLTEPEKSRWVPGTAPALGALTGAGVEVGPMGGMF
jgi:hypothetical protein